MGNPTDMFRRIVVAFDGSPSAHDALALAQRLRHPVVGSLLLAYVIPVHSWLRPGHAEPPPDAAADASLMLSEARATLPPGIPVELRTPGAHSPAGGLTELAEAEGADLVVVGSEHGVARARIGLTRTAGRLLHGAPCAVAVAPPGVRETAPFRHVGVALDGSAEASVALARAYAVARQGASALTIYAALDSVATQSASDDLRVRVQLQERLDAAADVAPPGVNPRTVLLYGAAGPAIANASDGVVDLLVTGSRSYGPLQRAMLGSVSGELVARATHPILVIPRQASKPAVASHPAAGAPAA